MLLETIERVRQRLNARQRVTAAVYLGLIGSIAVVLSLALSWISAGMGLVVGLVAATLGVLGLFRAGIFTLATQTDAAKTLDTLMATKDRALTILELAEPGVRSKAEVLERGAKCELIEAQCRTALTGFDPVARLPMEWSRARKLSAGAIPVLWIIAAALFAKLPGDKFHSEQAQAVAEIIAAHPELPAPVQETLRNLAQELDQESSGEAAEVEAALERAQAEIEQAKATLADQKRSRSEVTAKEELRERSVSSEAMPTPSQPDARSAAFLGLAPTPTPTPTPTHPPSQQQEQQRNQPNDSPQAQGEQSSEQQTGGAGGPAHQKPQEGQSADGAKQQQGTQGGATSGGGEHQSQQSQGAGEGAGQGQQQQGKGSNSSGDSSEGQGGGSGAGQQGEQGQQSSGSKPGSQGSQQGEGADGAQGGGGQSGQQNQGQGQAAGESGQSQGLDAAAQQLRELKSQRSQGESGGAGGGKSQGQKEAGQQGKGQDGGDRKGEGNKGQGQNKSGEKGGGEPPPQSSGSAQSSPAGQSGEGSEGQQSSAPKGGDKTQRDSGQPSAPKQSGDADAALGGSGGQAKRFDESGGKWPGLGEKKGFQEAQIAAQESSIDPRFTGQDTSIERNTEQAKFRVGLPDAALAKPDAVKGGEEQPIPLEYKDLLR